MSFRSVSLAVIRMFSSNPAYPSLAQTLRRRWQIWVDRRAGLDFLSVIPPQQLGLDESVVHRGSPSGNEYLQRVLADLNIQPGDCALDIGCAKGSAMRTMLEFPFTRVDGIEIADRLAATAAANFKRLGEARAQVFNEDATRFTGYGRYNLFYLYNPFPDVVMRRVVAELRRQADPTQETLVIYNAPKCHDLLVAQGFTALRDYPDQWGNGIRVYSTSPTATRLQGAAVAPAPKSIAGRATMASALALLVGIALTWAGAAQAQAAPEAELPDTPGSGAFPALKEEVASLPDHVVYRPARLDSVKPRQLGLYLFGNGACSDDGASSRMHLLEIASQGYVAIALGRIRTGPGTTLPLPAQQPPRPVDAEGRPVFPPPPTSYTGLLQALDWAAAQNKDAKSPYFGKFDEKAVAVSGFSCGGIQALRVAPDPRVKTVIVMNSGLFIPGTGVKHVEMDQPKSLLEKLHTPTLYVLGGPTDIAYTNGMDDFEKINHVPVAVANLKGVGHGGTYMQPNGGKAAAAVVAWLNWQLRGDKQAAQAFVGPQCGLCTDPAWELRKKKID